MGNPVEFYDYFLRKVPLGHSKWLKSQDIKIGQTILVTVRHQALTAQLTRGRQASQVIPEAEVALATAFKVL